MACATSDAVGHFAAPRRVFSGEDSAWSVCGKLGLAAVPKADAGTVDLRESWCCQAPSMAQAYFSFAFIEAAGMADERCGEFGCIFDRRFDSWRPRPHCMQRRCGEVFSYSPNILLFN